jgi:hypothetical protein
MQRGANAKSSFSAETTQTATQPSRFSIMLLIGWGRSLNTLMRPTSNYQFGARHCLPVCAYLRARSRFREFFQNIMQNTGKNSTTPTQPPECVLTPRSTTATGNASQQLERRENFHCRLTEPRITSVCVFPQIMDQK